eukprot:COSAG01_NODE_373_length_17991_cov_284.890075_3_plen_122_part_00
MGRRSRRRRLRLARRARTACGTATQYTRGLRWISLSRALAAVWGGGGLGGTDEVGWVGVPPQVAEQAAAAEARQQEMEAMQARLREMEGRLRAAEVARLFTIRTAAVAGITLRFCSFHAWL